MNFCFNFKYNDYFQGRYGTDVIRLLFFKDFSDFSLSQTMRDREAIAEVWWIAYGDSDSDGYTKEREMETFRKCFRDL